MNVILLENVENLGSIGDLVKVKPGYGRNYLLPQGKAKIASEENKAEIEARRAEFEQMAAEALAAAEKRRDEIEAKTFEITAKSGTEGKLFGSVGNIDIAAVISDAGIEVEKREVRLPEGPIRIAGEYEIVVHLHSDVNAVAKVIVIADENA